MEEKNNMAYTNKPLKGFRKGTEPNDSKVSKTRRER